jgi:hypothetical protein
MVFSYAFYVLSVLDITSKFHTAMLVNVDRLIIFRL